MTNKLLKIVPISGAAMIASENLKLLKKKKVKTEDIMKTGIKNIVGISLLEETANIIESF